MLEWFKSLSDANIITIGLFLLAAIFGAIKWFFSSTKDEGAIVSSRQFSTIEGNSNTVRQESFTGNTNHTTVGITHEQYKQDLEEKQGRIETLLIDQALSKRDIQDLTKQLAEVKTQLSDPHASYETHVKNLEQRIEELTDQQGIIPKVLLDEAIAALKAGDQNKADATLAKVEESAQSYIEAAAEAAYQRAHIANDQIEYRLAFAHAKRATQLRPDIGRYANYAGEKSANLAEFDKAIGYYEQALKSDLATFGEDHPTVAIVRNNLGLAWNLKGEFDKGMGYCEQALKSDLVTFGEGHTRVALRRNNLGGAWETKGEYDKAIGYYEQALKSGLVTFGEDHPTVAIYRNNLGTAWASKGEYDKAIGYYEQALKSDLATFGEGHPEVATRRNNLGSAWCSKGEYGKAIGYYEQALKSALATLGEEHPTTKGIQSNLLRAQEAKNE